MARPRSQNPILKREQKFGDRKGWRGRYVVYVSVNGQEKRLDRIKTFYKGKPGQPLKDDEFYTKEDAQIALNELVSRETSTVKIGDTTQPGASSKERPKTLGEAADRYLDSMSAGWVVNFQRSMESLFRKHIKGQRKGLKNGSTGPVVQVEVNPIGDMTLESLTREHLQDFFNAKGKVLCTSAMKKLRTHLGAILELAVDDGYIEKNRMKKVKLPKLRAVDKSVCTKEQFAAVMHWPGRDGLILNIAARCGLRPSELMALRANDFLGDRLMIDQGFVPSQGLGETKTVASNKAVSLPPELRRRLAFYIAENGFSGDDFLFGTRNGTPESQNNFVNRQMKEIGKEIGCPGLDFRMLRRSFGTYLAKHGNVKAVQGAMRHANPDMTFGEYVQEVQEETADAVQALEEEMLKLAATLRVKQATAA